MRVLVGITGGMGAGKSALAEMLTEFGALRVDADEVAREVAAIPAVIEQLQVAFGRDLLGPDGHLNRQELGRRALRSDEASQRLEAIMAAATISGHRAPTSADCGGSRRWNRGI